MSDIILCLEKICDAEQKYSEDPKQFIKQNGSHYGHKMAFFMDICDNFITKFNVTQDETNENSLLANVKMMCENFKKDLIVKIDLYSQTLQKYIQTNTKDDKDRGAQLYLNIMKRDIQQIKECQEIFYMFDQPESIKQAHCKKIDQNVQKINYSKNIMEEILYRIDLLNGIPQNQIINDENIQIQLQQENDNNFFMIELARLNVRIKAIQDIRPMNYLEALETQQDIIKSLYDSLIRYDGTNLELAQLKDMMQDELKSLIQGAIKDSQLTLSQTQSNIEDLQFSLQNTENDLQDAQQLINQRESLINSLQITLQGLEQKDILVVPQTKQFFSFSQQYQSPNYTITSSNILNKTANIWDLAVMVPSLDNIQGKCVNFGFKIKKTNSDVYGFAVGMGHLDIIQQKGFQINLDSPGHGCYMMALSGHIFSTSDSTINHQIKSFKSIANDIIYCTLNPTNKTLTFKKAQSSDSFVINYTPTQQQLHPCVSLFYRDNQVEFIQPNQINDIV